jgi:hypothetical protein
VGKFEAVTEGSAGGENRIPQAQRANLYAEINGASGTHFAQKDTTNLVLPSLKSGSARSGAPLRLKVNIAYGEDDRVFVLY